MPSSDQVSPVLPAPSTLLPLHEIPSLSSIAFTPRPCYQTLLRWSKTGVRGVILETSLIGGRRYTTPEAVEQFVERLNNASHATHVRRGVGMAGTHAGTHEPVPTHAGTRAERRSVEQVSQALDRLGI